MPERTISCMAKKKKLTKPHPPKKKLRNTEGSDTFHLLTHPGWSLWVWGVGGYQWDILKHLGAERLLLLGSFHCIQQSSSLPLRRIPELNIMSQMIFSLTSAKRSVSFSQKNTPQNVSNFDSQLFHMHLKGEIILSSCQRSRLHYINPFTIWTFRKTCQILTILPGQNPPFLPDQLQTWQRWWTWYSLIQPELFPSQTLSIKMWWSESAANFLDFLLTNSRLVYFLISLATQTAHPLQGSARAYRHMNCTSIF